MTWIFSCFDEGKKISTYSGGALLFPPALSLRHVLSQPTDPVHDPDPDMDLGNSIFVWFNLAYSIFFFLRGEALVWTCFFFSNLLTDSIFPGLFGLPIVHLSICLCLYPLIFQFRSYRKFVLVLKNDCKFISNLKQIHFIYKI